MVRKSDLKSLRRRNPFTRLVQNILIIVVALQALTVIVLRVVAGLRVRHKREARFPHLRLHEVQVGDNYLQLYAYGAHLYAAMLEAIDNARECIYLESYIWKGDAVGEELKAHLIQKAEQGVDVYVVFDAFANLVVPRSFKHFPPCIHMLEYQPIRRPWHIFDPRRYALDHRKMLVVDGSIGFIGGYNLGSLYATEWRDTHLRLRGPAAADLAHSFVSFWNRSNVGERAITRHYPRKFDPLINIRIRVLVPWQSNHIVADWLARGYFTECLKGGLRIFGYHYAMLHAKTCSVDGQWVTLGTANLDRLSSIGNFEINVEIYSVELAQQMQELFESDTTGMFELTLEKWKSRPWYVKLSERILAPLRFFL